MWLSNLKTVLFAAPLALAACGFTPVYGPGGGGQALQGAIRATDPANPTDYAFVRRFEERMGRGALYNLGYTLTVSQTGMGSTSTGSTTRIRLDGRATLVLSDAATGAALLRETVSGFTGYSTTGNTAATLAAKQDARERLMVILADKAVDVLLLNAADLAQARP